MSSLFPVFFVPFTVLALFFGIGYIILSLRLTACQPGCGLFFFCMLGFFAWNFLLETFGVDFASIICVAALCSGLATELTAAQNEAVRRNNRLAEDLNREIEAWAKKRVEEYAENKKGQNTAD